MDKFSLRGKVAIVTGGNRGHRQGALRVGFAEAGAAVAIVARDEEKNEETLAELRGLGANAIAVKANVATASDLEAMLATVTDRTRTGRRARQQRRHRLSRRRTNPRRF